MRLTIVVGSWKILFYQNSAPLELLRDEQSFSADARGSNDGSNNKVKFR